ncbi:MAG: leucine-rich repeat domain-containing protein [Cyclobacteriaceae bacterium]
MSMILLATIQTAQSQATKNTDNVADMDRYREEVKQLVAFLEVSLNALGNSDIDFQDKDVIISQSYLKIFRDSKVQIEDDLIDNRDVVTNKDAQAYLKDVDFFFKNVSFKFLINDIVEQRTDNGNLSFRVRMNRTIKGDDINGKQVENTKPRFIEINVDEAKRDLKIVSIYTTRLSEKEELANWWNSMSYTWKNILGSDLPINDTLTLADVGFISDKQVLVSNQPFETDIPRMFGTIKRAAKRDSLNISGMAAVHELSALTEIEGLKKLNISHTSVNDLLPLRGLTNLEELYCAATPIEDLNALRYSKGIKVLDLSFTSISDLSPLENFDKLERIYLHNTVVDDLEPLSYVSTLRELYLFNSNVSDLTFASELKELRRINFSNTTVADLKPLSGLKELEKLDFENTLVSDLSPLADLQNLTMIVCNRSKVKNLMPLVGNKALKAIYCEQSQVQREDVVRFLQERPDCEVIFNTEYLVTWWKELPAGWRRSIAGNDAAEVIASKEKIHQLLKKQELDLSGMSDIVNLEPVKLFYGLKKLNCSNTPLKNIDALANQIDLEYLNCNHTLVSDVSPLSKLEKLKVLKMENTKVEQIHQLSLLSQLDSLFMASTLVKDISIINQLPGLLYADFEKTGVSVTNAAMLNFHSDSLVLLFQAEALQSWWVRMPESWRTTMMSMYKIGHAPSSIELHRITSLKEIELKSLDINTLEPITSFYRLRKLNVAGSRVTSLNPLADITTIEELDCSRIPLNDIDPLQNMANLKYLSIEQTPVGDLSPLSNLENLEVLLCSGTSVRDLSPLARHGKLRELDCANTRVRNLNGLDHMPELRLLKVYNNRISSRRIEAFKSAHPECEVVFY